jgi:hypothetical protein
MMPQTKTEQLRSLQTEELFLRGQLIDICLTFGNPRTNRVFKITKRMELAELFATHAEQMPEALNAAYKKLCAMREILKANHIDVGTL